MAIELPPHDPGFTYDEQYRTAGWRATFRMFELLGDDPIMEDETKHISTAVRTLAGLALKNVPQFIDDAARTNEFPYYNDFIAFKMIENKNWQTDPDIRTMSLLYTKADDVWREVAERFEMERFDNDIELLANFHLDRLKEMVDEPSFSIMNYVAAMQHDNDFYLGMWDTERLIGTGEVPTESDEAA